MIQQSISFTLNGMPTEISVDPLRRLADVLREDLDLIGTKIGCNAGHCGACTILFDGRQACSCMISAAQAMGRDVVTVEGLSRDGTLHPVQEAFRDNHALQCGFCTPGMIMQAIDLLAEDPHPDEHAIRHGLEGNLCRCTGYQNIVRAVQDAAHRLEAKAVAAQADSAGGVR